MNPNLVISIPVYNESYRIINFLDEILSSFANVDGLQINVVNDYSTDDTLDKLNLYISSSEVNIKINVISNKRNLGHGGSLIIGLLKGYQANNLLTVDGDHMVSGDELYAFYQKSLQNNFMISVGCRNNHGVAFFRKITTFIVRLIVFLKTGSWEADCNSPIRFYKSGVISNLDDALKYISLTPNIIFTIYMIRNKMKFSYIPISLRSEHQFNLGTTWKSQKKNIPSLRFIKFCFKSFIKVLKF